MSISKKLLAHIGKKNIVVEIVPHKTVFTAYDLAQTLGHKLDEIVKTLLVKVDFPKVTKKAAAYYIVAVPASYHLDLKKIQKLLGAVKVSFVSEKIMAKLGIRPGALTPFASYRKLGLVADKALLKTKSVLIGAESFTESFRLKIKDLLKSENATTGVIGKKNRLKLQKRSAPPKKRSRILRDRPGQARLSRARAGTNVKKKRR